jgi:MFS transporter, DHA1 family, multidrug resistance protein
VPGLHISKHSKNIFVLFGLLTIIEGVLWYLLPIYFESKLNSLLLVGVIIAAHPLAILMSSLPMGDLSDKMGRKFVFIIGVIGFAGSFAFLSFTTFWAFLAFMVVYGIFSIAYKIAAFVGVLDHSVKFHIGESTGMFESVEYAGWLIGSVAAGVLLFLFPVGMAIKILTVILIAVAVLAIKFFPGKIAFNLKRLIKGEKILVEDRVYFGGLRAASKFGKPLVAILAFSFAWGFWEYAIWTFEPIYSNSIGSGFLLGALILGLVSLPGALAGFTSGKLTDRIGSKEALIAGSVLILVGQGVFLVSRSLVTLGASLALTAIGVMLIWIPISIWLKTNVPRKVRGQVDSTTETFYSIGGVGGPLVVGTALSIAGASVMFWWTAALFAISIVALGVWGKIHDV